MVLRTQKDWSSKAVGEGFQKEVCLRERSKITDNLPSGRGRRGEQVPWLLLPPHTPSSCGADLTGIQRKGRAHTASWK